MLPREFPPRSTVQRYCYAWREDGTWRRINYQLLMQARLAAALPPEAWQVVTWREGTAEPLASRLAALRARPAQGDSRRSLPRPEEWLLVEWPEDEPQPAEFWLSNLPADTPTERPVHLAKRRWLIERNYLELKQELGLGHFEGRGFQHYAALRVAGYGFLSAERAAIPPSGPGSAWLVKTPVLPDGHRPHGTAAPARASHPAFNRDPAPTHRPRPRTDPAAMSVLCTDNPAPAKSLGYFVTQ